MKQNAEATKPDKPNEFSGETRTWGETKKAKIKLLVGRAGFEPATFRLSVERSSRAELPARV